MITKNKRVDFYCATYSKKHNSFAISPERIHEDALKFIWEDKDGNKFEKIVPTKYWGPHLGKYKVRWDYDEILNKREYRGGFFTLIGEVIFNYK